MQKDPSYLSGPLPVTFPRFLQTQTNVDEQKLSCGSFRYFYNYKSQGGDGVPQRLRHCRYSIHLFNFPFCLIQYSPISLPKSYPKLEVSTLPDLIYLVCFKLFVPNLYRLLNRIILNLIRPRSYCGDWDSNNSLSIIVLVLVVCDNY